VITVMLCGEPDATGMVVDFGEAKRVVKEVLERFDHKLIAPADAVMGPPDAQGILEIAFTTRAGPHRLFVPATEVAVIDRDATVEHLSALLAEAILRAMPANVQRVMVRMFEGVGKSALSMVGVAGDQGPGLLAGTDTTGRLLSLAEILIQSES
jgi:6-pyruvoyltetrahydropterin/6-carboxytetrahydropterin synthase